MNATMTDEFSHLTADEQQQVTNLVSNFYPDAHPLKARLLARFITRLADLKYEEGDVAGFQRGFNEGRRLGQSEGFNSGRETGYARGIEQMKGVW
jgi:hypothetical protein